MTTWRNSTKKVRHTLSTGTHTQPSLLTSTVVSENVQLNSALEKARGEIRVNRKDSQLQFSDYTAPIIHAYTASERSANCAPDDNSGDTEAQSQDSDERAQETGPVSVYTISRFCHTFSALAVILFFLQRAPTTAVQTEGIEYVCVYVCINDSLCGCWASCAVRWCRTDATVGFRREGSHC